MKVRNFLKIVSLLLLITLLSSCYFQTPGAQWIGLSGSANHGFAYFQINLLVASVSLRLGVPFGLGFYAFSDSGFNRFGITHPIRFLPGIHIQLLPVLQPLLRKHRAAGIHILIISAGIGI